MIGKINSKSGARARKDWATTSQTAEVIPYGEAVEIDGFTIDPAGEAFRVRYRIAGKNTWLSAVYVDLPFEELPPLNDAYTWFDQWATFRSVFSYNISSMLEELQRLGVVLIGGPWTVAEVDQVHFVTTLIADNCSIFKELFAPMVIERKRVNNVSDTDAFWYARNNAGYHIVLGNMVFFERYQKTKLHPRWPYTSDDLIAHEICHNINFRYPITQWAKQVRNEKLRFVARSSDHPAEIITDAAANYFLSDYLDLPYMEEIMRHLEAKIEAQDNSLQGVLTRLNQVRGYPDLQRKLYPALVSLFKGNERVRTIADSE